MKRIFQLSTLAITTILGMSLWLDASQATNAASASGSSALVQNTAKALFDKSCAKCHGKDGRAKTFRGKLTGAQNFTDKSWQESNRDEDMIETIENGRGKMPSYKNKLTLEQIQSLVVYIRKFKK
jgi:mono/diheme cytochrome c family protein